MKKWEVAAIDKEKAKLLAEECDVDPFVAMLSASRGYDEASLLEEFLSDDLIFSDIYEMPDIIKAAQIINDAIINGENIAVYGDYDCDGVTATALMYTYLRDKGANVIYYIPDRFEEGYGLNIKAIDELYNRGVKLIVTVDNGISAVSEIQYANSLNMTTVISDHHLPPDILPCAAAIVNPHLIGSNVFYKDICGVAVAFKLVCAIENAQVEEMLPKYGDLVAIGTIADVMPLIGENRAFVKYGLRNIKNSNRMGLVALMHVAGVDFNDCNETKIVYGIIPRINAAGRMGNADRALKLLTTCDEDEAIDLANEINDENASRQQLEKVILSEAISIIDVQSLNHDRVIVVGGENWHHGVVGIVASRLVELYGKPVIVFSKDGELSHGSGRSISGFSLYDCINFASDLTEKFGGHCLAAGVTIKTKDIVAFRNKVNDFARKVDSVVPVLKLDCKLNVSALHLDLVDTLVQMKPYGNGNPSPVFGVYGAQLEKITEIGQGKHLKLWFVKGPSVFQAVMFSVSEDSFPYKVGDFLDLAVSLEENIFNNKRCLSIQIKELRTSGINDGNLAEQIAIYDDFYSDINRSYEEIAPNREECAIVYKFISKGKVSAISVYERFMNEIGYAKTRIIIDILSEMNLINSVEDKIVYLEKNQNSMKVNLEDSNILKKVRG